MRAILILHDIRSAENVGSIFRTADAVGVEKVYISGITPTPIDRFGRAVGAIKKTALGAEKTIPWEKAQDVLHLIKKMKNEKLEIIAIEQASGSVDYKKVTPTSAVFIVGNEVAGLSREILNLVDVVAEIPMKGKKESLNVSVAVGVALYRMLNI
jgi:23S rRNA (guanosine2251-2'-O)-methyltransferase